MGDVSGKTEMLFGIHPVSEALSAGRRKIHEIYITKEKEHQRIGQIIKKSNTLGIPVRHVSRKEIQSLCANEAHQGVAARAGTYPLMTLPELISRSEARFPQPLYLLIDHVVDPHNLGALIRTALCSNVSGVIIPKDRSASPTPVVSKTSAGALEHIRLAQVANMVYAMEDLKKTGVWMIGLDGNGPQSLFQTDLAGSTGIVIGAEESGLRPLVKKHCDFLVFIPQSGPVSSLNASVAGGIALYEAFRQRLLKQS